MRNLTDEEFAELWRCKNAAHNAVTPGGCWTADHLSFRQFSEEAALCAAICKCWRHRVIRSQLNREERNGMDYALQMLQEQRDSASKQKAAEIVQRVKQLHVAEISPGTKVTFTKKFSGDKAYTYLALKVDDEKAGQLWFVTGRERGLTNERFEELLAEKLGFERFELLFPSVALKAASDWIAPPAPSQTKYDIEPKPVKGWGADVSPTGSTSNEPEPIKGTTSAPKFDLGPIKDLSEASGEEDPT